MARGLIYIKFANSPKKSVAGSHRLRAFIYRDARAVFNIHYGNRNDNSNGVYKARIRFGFWIRYLEV